MQATKKVRQAFASQKCAARRRGIIFLLLLEEWIDIWQRSGKFHLRGKRSSEYCMARFGDRGAYVVGNVRIMSNSENHAEQDHPPNIYSEISRTKMSAAKKGIKLSAETRRRMSIAQSGKTLSEETKAKIAKSHIGIRPSEATKEKIRQTKLRNREARI
jgi:hypothetical protein